MNWRIGFIEDFDPINPGVDHSVCPRGWVTRTRYTSLSRHSAPGEETSAPLPDIQLVAHLNAGLGLSGRPPQAMDFAY